ncbi:MAG: hypothetical protein BA863_02925 [Desulfovibrio sp. S3730MH75]|nr:MAG: hypothetical protein BA863_02925 [Desulfovibrio sp. S3730MH75]
MNKIQRISDFTEYVAQLKGDEKGEAQLFCDRFFRAFGHGGILEANGALEARIKFSSGKTKFADCLWSPPGRSGVLIEMKKRAEKNLEAHFPQVRDYWVEMNPEIAIGPGAQKPTYIIICNFDRFLIYKHLTLVDDINIKEFEDRLSAFNFMLTEEKEPLFHHNIEEISQTAARTIGELFKYLTFDRNENREDSQRFLLQCVLALFSEDFGLLPNFFFSEIIRDCKYGASSYDLIGGLFKQMANPKPAKGGRFKEIKYFNGGLFDAVEPVELDDYCLDLLAKAAEFNWKNVNPAIFGALFEGTMNASERHAFGAHFTSEADVQKIINPTIVRPWKVRINKAKTLSELTYLHEEISKFRVLDPACGCGNFLFVAYLTLKDLEMSIIEKMAGSFARSSLRSLNLGISRISTRQLFGLDVLPIAVEVAKTTMMLAKEVAAEKWNNRIGSLMGTLGLSFDEGLPLDRLDDCIYNCDALLQPWPEFDVVVGNPPYQSKNKMKQEMDPAYIEKVRKAFPEVPGRADFCVYWIYKAHTLMKVGQRSGLVGTNTIRQNYSRKGGLDFVVNNGGVITDAVSSQVWSGDAVVHVSIVNWIKGVDNAPKMLANQLGDSIDSQFEYFELAEINSALSANIDLSNAKDLMTNAKSGACYQGQTHGHKGFLLSLEEFNSLESKTNVYPYLIGEDLLSKGYPNRYVIDLNYADDVFEAKEFKELFNIIKVKVYPDIKDKADKEAKRSGKNTGPRQNHYKKWWKYWRARAELIEKINHIDRYIVCSRVTKRPIFEFVSSKIRPNDALQVFPLEDDYSFGIVQSNIHWEWFKARCSTLKGDWRYTSNTVFDSFPWPQNPGTKEFEKVCNKSRMLRESRNKTMNKYNWSLRDLYRVMEESDENPVSKAQKELDLAVLKAYGFKKRDSILNSLFILNGQLAKREENREEIQGPGVPLCFKNNSKYLSSDCLNGMVAKS